VATPTLVVPAQPATPGDPAKAIEAPKGAPDKYAEFKADGLALNPEAVTAWDAAAKSIGLTQEQRDAAIKFQTDFVNSESKAWEKQAAAEEAARPAAIAAAIAKDPALGGPDAVAKAATMQRAVEAFGGAEFKAFLDKQHPDTYLQFARFALKVGQAIKEDSVAGTQGKAGPQEKRAADVMFGPQVKPAS